MQRLKNIEQSGYQEPYFPGCTFKRFEHSVGVYWLLKLYGASLEEQIAGLIHDVSHAAFSHCVDYALEGGDEKGQSHQDNIHDDFVKNSDIAPVLEKYGFDLKFILNDDNFPLKENSLPDICADRIDYALRTACSYQKMTVEEAGYYLKNLLVKEKSWYFNSFEAAKRFAGLFEELNKIYFAGLPSAIMHRTVGDYLKRALQQKYITKQDLYMTDQEVLDKINMHLSDDAELRICFDRMNNKIKTNNNPSDYDVHIFTKSRVIDPLFLDNGSLSRVSDRSSEWRMAVASNLLPKEYFLKFER